ncbi:unnamed protein product [marine sediment metagenome]|uniref:Fibronectin type-III domain-containing protein n=1 Tax=marine sediment metagenome TaxID=412755 RepID=X1MS09_9ZZZZ
MLSKSEIISSCFTLNSAYSYLSELPADATSTQTLAKNNSIALLDEDKNIIDAVAWGSSTDPFVENIPFPQNPAENQSLGRKTNIEGDYIDTDNNSQDFELQGPTPINSQGERGNVQPPYPVPDFQVATSTDNTVILTWSTTTDPDTPNEEISYILYWSKDKEITEDNLTTATSTTTTTATLTLSDLYYDSTYYFGIRAFDRLNYSSLATTSYSIPLPKITDLNAGTSAVREAIDLFWTAPGAESYLIKYAEKEIVKNSTSTDKISWGEATLVENSIVPKSWGETESFSVENLTPNKTYYFAVKSISEKNATSEIGGVMSISQLYWAGSRSLFVAWSLARTEKLCSPSNNS